MMLLQMKNDKQMIATDSTQRQKLDISFVLLLETQEGEVPVMMSLDNMKLKKLITQTEVQFMPSIDMKNKVTKEESNTNSGGMMLLQ